ncbi:hypothetical protein F5148DRAFT_974997 [Russula earlei]|uniref:Uncharacterized protein n=1 Tax=Russula earlei TaxID=71964 RepID=A0ACC0UIS6_9AGAM|nr:hypothetical protein F5148DRAFT_974997 [Russula earlei]
MSTHEGCTVVHESRDHDPTRPHSFDLTLELEHQLEAESLPTSPARHEGRPQSLDTHVLASLVTSLRFNNSELSKERHELSAALEVARRREAELASEVHQLKEAQVETNSELAVLRQKTRDDEESIVLLRSKVEESRRGLMRLQTESRRVSRGADASVDLSRASSYSFGGPPSAKRLSFTPLTGSSAGRMANHRRISSLSDSNVSWSEVTNGQTADVSPNPQIVTLPDTSPQCNYPPTSTRRFSGLFVRSSAPDSEPLPGLNAVERENLQREIQTLKAALEEVRHELTETNEAREASETCVKTLRDFIAENNVGLPPLRHDIGSPVVRSDDADRKNAGGGGGSRWGFSGLFRAGETSSPLMSSRGASANTSPSPTGEPLSRKLGGLFGSKGYTPAGTRGVPIPIVQDATYNGSDTSSTAESAEPVSPRMEISQVPVTRVLSGTPSTSTEQLALRTVTEEKNGGAGLLVV